MKRVFVAFFVIAFFNSMCFAEEVSTSPVASAPVYTETFTGRIDSVSTGAEKKQQVTIRVGDGGTTVFLIAADAAIIGKDGNTTTLSWLKGNNVSVEYTTLRGVRTAKSIKVLSDF